MNCPNCNTELKANAKFCPSCGRPAPKMNMQQNTQSQQEQPSAPQVPPTSQAQSAASLETAPGKKNNKVKIGIVAAVLAVLLIGSAITYGMLFMNNPKSLYFLAEGKASEAMNEGFSDKYSEMLEFNEKMLEAPSTNKTKISGNFEVENDYSGEFAFIQQILEEVAITVDSKNDPKKNASASTVAIEMDGESLVDADVLQTEDQLGVKLPLVGDEYYYLNLDQYGEFMRMIDPTYEGPDEIEVKNQNLNDLTFTEKEIDKLKKRYYKYLDETLKEEYFSLEKNVEYKHDGKEFKLRELTLELSPKQTEEFINGFVDELIADKDLRNMMAKRIVDMNEVTAIQGDIDFSDQSTVEDEIKALLESFKDVLKDVNYPKGFKSVLLIDKDEKIIDRQMKLVVNSADEEVNFEVSTKNVPLEKDKSYREFEFQISPEKQEGKLGLTISNEIAKKAKETTEKIKANVFFEDNGYEHADYELMLNTVTKGEKGKQDIVYDFELTLNGGLFGTTAPTISGKVKYKNDISLEDQNWNQKFDINVQYDQAYSGGAEVSLVIDSKTKLKDKVSIPKLDENNGKNIMNLTEEDMVMIMMKLQEAAIKLTGQMGLY